MDAVPGAWSDCDQKPKLPFCNDSKLPSRNVSSGPEKSCTPIRAGEIKLPSHRGLALLQGGGTKRLCNKATPPHGVALLCAHIKLPRRLDAKIKLGLRLVRGLKICCTFARVKLSSYPLAFALQSS